MCAESVYRLYSLAPVTALVFADGETSAVVFHANPSKTKTHFLLHEMKHVARKEFV